MAVSNIKAILQYDIHKVWEVTTTVEQYTWRSDLGRAEILNEKQLVEYTQEGFATTFTITVTELYKRWEFDMENENMTGHWTGLFTAKGESTEIDFTEEVTAKKFFMKPFLKPFLKKQQAQFVADLEKALHDL